MPRNPHKRCCRVPGCRSWAMRGQDQCRSHRDHELGPRGAGAPLGNLNAFKTGEFAALPDSPTYRKISYNIATDPEHFPHIIAQISSDLYEHCGDPLVALRMLNRLIPPLIPYVADSIFLNELEDVLLWIPPTNRPSFLSILYKHTLPLNPTAKLEFLRSMGREIYEIQFPEEQLPEPN